MCCFTMCESRLYGCKQRKVDGRIFSKEKERGKMQNDKKIGEIKNKFIYNNNNAYLSVPLLMMSARRMNLCKEKKGWGWGWGGGEDDEKEREKKKEEERTPSCLSKAAKAK